MYSTFGLECLLLTLLLVIGCGTDISVTKQRVDDDADGYAADVDCDDGHATVHPDAEESCDGIDQDCDGLVDEDPTDAPTWYADDDLDGYGAAETVACTPPAGSIDLGGDCDDTIATVHPGADEHCDGVDEDCDGAVDEDALDPGTYYTDADGDGYGDEAVETCDGTGLATEGGDCDEARSDVHPGAAEADCTDPVDYNCDGSVGYADADGDGAPACGDCDDGDGTAFPGAPETCDGVDDNCDGVVDEGVTSTFYADADGDGYGDAGTAADACDAPDGYVSDATDCADDAAGVHPGAAERCDGIDEDCDGAVDEDATDATSWYADADGDGYGDPATVVVGCEPPVGYVVDALDCDDRTSGVHPGASEVCDGVDQDCDGAVDEDAVDSRTWYADVDGDAFGDGSSPASACDSPAGYVASDTDCDDDADDVHPGAPESCDGRDEDCDGVIDEDATDAIIWYVDGDGDGHGAESTVVASCDAPAGYVSAADDCNDADADTYPAAPEVCDGADHDCDGAVNESDAEDASLWYQDADGDGYGDSSAVVTACDPPLGYVGTATDCDDAASAVHPGAGERCDAANVDEDCDGLRDDADASPTGTTVWYRDADGDGYGSTTATAACDQPAGYAATATDCDDTSATISPAAAEVCDAANVDEDCDGLADDQDTAPNGRTTWYRDADTDGYGGTSSTAACDAPAGYVRTSTDCDDAAAAVHPGATEVCDALNVDEDCDGGADDADGAPSGTTVWYRDADADGYGGSGSVATCDIPAVYVPTSTDCNDTVAAIHPGATEVCDPANADEDCDGLADDLDAASGRTTWYRDADSDTFGGTTTTTACDVPAGYVATSTDCNDANSAVSPAAAEVCDAANVDEDCDGAADDTDASATGQSTWYADVDADTWGGSTTARTCDRPVGYVAAGADCNDAAAGVNPGATEVCDPANVDEDCDGLADDADTAAGRATWYADVDADGYGGTTSTVRCDAPAGYLSTSTDCNDAVFAIHPGALEVCDPLDVDEDCDGLADDADPSVDPSGQVSYYADLDGDGYGDGATLTQACDEGAGAASDGTDCDDTDDATYPGAAEVDDGVDNDCDGLVDNTGAWHTETVVASGAEDALSAAINASDSMVAVFGSTSGTLHLYRAGATSWTGSSVTTSGSPSASATAIDSSGNVHIVYDNRSRQYMFYDVVRGTTVTSSVLDTDCSLLSCESCNGIAALDDGTVRLVWTDGLGAYVRYGRGTQSSLTTNYLFSATPLALDMARDPVSGHMALGVYISTYSVYGYQYTDTWSSIDGDLLDYGTNAQRSGEGVSVAYDPDGVLHAAWYAAGDNAILYATYSGTSFTTETVASISTDVDQVRDLDLAFDSAGTPHLAWTSVDASAVLYYPITYATKNGSWTTTSLATSADHPTFVEVLVDSADVPHVLAILSTSSALKHYYLY